MMKETSRTSNRINSTSKLNFVYRYDVENTVEVDRLAFVKNKIWTNFVDHSSETTDGTQFDTLLEMVAGMLVYLNFNQLTFTVCRCRNELK